MTVKSVYEDQSSILQGIMDLRGIDRFDVDLTYGNGSFYRSIPEPRLKFDLDDTLPGIVVASSHRVPLPTGSVGSVVFDPPFLTYVRQGRTGNGKMIMAKRFAGYWRYDELSDHYRAMLYEADRILRKGGVLIFKCQDIVHNHRLHATHVNVVRWAEDIGFRLADLFVLAAKHRLPSPNRRGTQKHARIHHSYFLLLEKG